MGDPGDAAVLDGAEAHGAGLRRGEPSRTAMMGATMRGVHRLEHPPPWVFDDPYALSLVGSAWPEVHAALSQVGREPVLRRLTAMAVARARHVEDRLNGSFTQYVVLGAGLDSFAWRRPDLLRTLRVFEVDHPATQDWKRERVAALALPSSDRHVFAPIDFETATLRDGLTAAGFDWSQPTLYSWLGVTYYLPLAAVEATLRAVATGASGSEIVMSYIPTPEFLDELGLEWLNTSQPLAAQSGEPFDTFFSPTEAEAMAGRCGLSVVENLAREDLHERYFTGRSDALTPLKFERYLTASVV